MHQFSNPAVLTEEGVFVGEKWIRLNEIIQDHWPDVSLRWIPPVNRSNVDSSKPYAIVHSPSNAAPYIIMFASELDDPVTILAKLYQGNTHQKDVASFIEAQEDAEAMFELKKAKEAREEAIDMAAWFVGTHKNWVKMKRPDGSIYKIDRTLPNGGR